MSILTFTDEFTSPLPAKRMFNAFLENHNIIPKAAPQFLKNVEVIAGDGGPGSIKKWNFAEGVELKPFSHKIDAVDKEKLTTSSTVINGESIMENFESTWYETKVEASAGGGCKVTTVTKYYPKPGAQINKDKIKEHEKKVRDTAMAAFKVVEGYLLANPTVCA